MLSGGPMAFAPRKALAISLLVASCSSAGRPNDGPAPHDAGPDGSTDTAAPPDVPPPSPDTSPSPDRSGPESSPPDRRGDDVQPDVQPDVPPDPPVTAMRSFSLQVRHQVDNTSSSPLRDLPMTAVLNELAATILEGPSPRLVVSQRGLTRIVALVADGGGRWRTTAPFTIGDSTLVERRCHTVGAATYDELSLVIAGDSLTGTARGKVKVMTGSVVHDQSITGTVTGAPDRAPPTFEVAAAPATGASVTASEALPEGVNATLRSTNGATVLPLRRDPARGAAALFYTDAPLAPGTTYLLRFDPRAVDLAGNEAPAAALPPVSIPPLALLANEGFERRADDLTLGNAIITDETSNIPAIQGRGSLVIKPWGGALGPTYNRDHLTARLAVKPGDTVVRARVRALLSRPEMPPAFGAPFELVNRKGLRSSAEVPAAIPPFQDLGRVFIPSPTNTWLGQTTTLEISLPPETEGEVFLVTDRLTTSCGPQQWAAGIQIDDLRVE